MMCVPVNFATIFTSRAFEVRCGANNYIISYRTCIVQGAINYLVLMAACDETTFLVFCGKTKLDREEIGFELYTT